MQPLVLANGHVRLECFPGHGFVITRISRSDDDANILWNPNPMLTGDLGNQLGEPGLASVAGFDRGILAGGWFPMFPTAGAPGVGDELWMHGELPRVSWKVMVHTEDTVTCVVSTPSSGFDATRTVRLDESVVRVGTTVVNRSDARAFVTVGEHPCFSREFFAGGEIEIGPSSIAVPVGPDKRHNHSPYGGTGGSVCITSKAARRVELDWSSDILPHVLVWEHYLPENGLPGADVFAVEPMSYAGTSLDDARGDGARIAIEPGASLSWWMELRLA